MTTRWAFFHFSLAPTNLSPSREKNRSMRAAWSIAARPSPPRQNASPLSSSTTRWQRPFRHSLLRQRFRRTGLGVGEPQRDLHRLAQRVRHVRAAGSSGLLLRHGRFLSGKGRAFPRCHARFRVWLLRGWEAGRWVGALLSNLYGAFPAPRRCSCPIVGAPAVAFAGAGEPRTRARASDDNLQPRFRHATGPAPPPSLIPGAHQVPVRAMTDDYESGGKDGDERFLTNASSH